MTPRTIIRAAALACTLLALAAGCATRPPVSTADRVFLARLERIPDDDFQCGPSSLTAVLRYHGVAADLAHVRDAIYSPGARGVIVQDLVWYAREQGLAARSGPATIADLRREIADGRPVIVQVDVGRFGQRINHFMVVAGFQANALIIHSGDDREKTIADHTFDRMWQATGRTAVFIEAPP